VTTALTLPRLAGSRELVLRLLAPLPPTLHGTSVEVGAQGLASAAPSFVDELVKEILVNRDAKRLTVRHASERLAHYLKRSAKNRGVGDKLVVYLRDVGLEP
jgi:hypothetical protein